MHYFGAFDGMRGIAVLTVAIYHVEWLYWGYDSAIIRHAAFMVDFFFVLSGFVICHNYGHQVSSRAQVRRFMLLRLWRIYPVHFVFLEVLLAIEFARLIGGSWFGIPPNVVPFADGSNAILAGNLLLIHSLGFFDRLAFNVPSWTISTEYFAYLVFAMVFLLLGSRRSRILASVVIAGACMAALLTFNDGSLFANTARFGFVRCLTGFFCGVMVWHAYMALHGTDSLATRPAVCAGLSLVFLALWGMLVKFGYGSSWEFVMLPVICGLLLTIALNEKGLLARLLGSDLLVGLGKISYSVYMAHVAVLWVFSQVLRFGFKAPLVANDHGTLTYQTDPLMGGILLLAYIAAVLAVSRWCFVHIEEVFRRKSKARFRQPAE